MAILSREHANYELYAIHLLGISRHDDGITYREKYSHYWYWFHITLESVAIHERGAIKSDYVDQGVIKPKKRDSRAGSPCYVKAIPVFRFNHTLSTSEYFKSLGEAVSLP